MGFAAALRHYTAPLHDAVDAAYARYNLGDRASYTAFLKAHARALGAVEPALTGLAVGGMPRMPSLSQDLADLGEALPPPLAFDGVTDDAERWGALYVVEGSRLGGALLARSVADDLPKRYLSAAHRPGEWRALREAIDSAAAAQDDRWRRVAREAADRVFDLYGRAAAAAE